MQLSNANSRKDLLMCIHDDVLNAGAPFHVFAQLVTGERARNLCVWAVSRVTTQESDHETQSDFMTRISVALLDDCGLGLGH